MCLRQNRVAAAITLITAQWASAHLRPDLSSPIAFAHRSCLEGRMSQAQIHWFLFSLSRFAYWCLTGISAEFGCMSRAEHLEISLLANWRFALPALSAASG